jgi:hypothetical protein
MVMELYVRLQVLASTQLEHCSIRGDNPGLQSENEFKESLKGYFESKGWR